MTCATCRFWVKANKLANPPEGNCHRYPATVALVQTSKGALATTIWPMIRATEWCGEWQQRDPGQSL
jgi:hypothetical protein